ncbi:MAG TPA: 7-cyano-7-deazaguanine synthase [Vicinamibacterales bacterium]|jgi:7-cyano-7-deazaguanine synthase|nr:7-cyano-7-deazaguanine synthase [Vicinamibacterales bacterium]
MTRLSDHQITRCAVLLSGGLDSAVLLADEATRSEVQPIYVSAGLAWEAAERAMVDQLLASAALRGRVAPLVALSVDMRDVYAKTHWAITGRPPAYDTPDEDVYLHGRNIVLLGKAGVFCAAAHIERLVMGTLAHNPFPDATPAFRSAMTQALSLGLAHTLRIDAPYAEVSKAEVIRKGIALGVPFDLTLSCMNPGTGLHTSTGDGPRYGTGDGSVYGDPSPVPVHCGTCSKCRERHNAFIEAGLSDPTEYINMIHVS